MPEPQRQQILVNLETAIDAITTRSPNTTGFQTKKVRCIERVLRHWDDVEAGLRPWVGIMPERERKQYLPGSVIRIVLPIRLLAYTETYDDIKRRDIEVNRFLDDLIVAVNADQTLGGCAVMVTVLDTDTDEGDDATFGIVEMNLEIVYFRSTSKSNT